eukprot:TRINITY_DN22291_c0_g1_i2.p3 TRINITY_DN22291_c0_g1~~TRINITY_DN22291_c0_g1_i2.p3  ORF type:complete len:204 (-),score=-5.49 TRINITY_DN22291_c0_g1_i2:20-631(-)
MNISIFQKALQKQYCIFCQIELRVDYVKNYQSVLQIKTQLQISSFFKLELHVLTRRLVCRSYVLYICAFCFTLLLRYLHLEQFGFIGSNLLCLYVDVQKYIHTVDSLQLKIQQLKFLSRKQDLKRVLGKERFEVRKFKTFFCTQDIYIQSTFLNTYIYVYFIFLCKFTKCTIMNVLNVINMAWKTRNFCVLTILKFGTQIYTS